MKIYRNIPIVRDYYSRLNVANYRREFVKKRLSLLPVDVKILDAGAGTQQYRKYAKHLAYYSQDFGQYVNDEKSMIGADLGGVGGVDGFEYGPLDYCGDIWNIDEQDSYFDAILCTEVFEHIPHPIKTINEFSRLLKTGGELILTAPSNCLRHMDPYFFYSGFSDRWYEKFLEEAGFEILSIEPVGDYYSWLGVEMARTAMAHNFFAKCILLPAFLYYFSKGKTKESVDTLCMGYHVHAKKK